MEAIEAFQQNQQDLKEEYENRKDDGDNGEF